MKYRIKKLTFSNGETEYMPQKKSFFGWRDMIGWPLKNSQKAQSIISDRIGFNVKKIDNEYLKEDA